MFGTGSVDHNVGATDTLTIGNNNASGDFGGVISASLGGLNLTKTGTGTQVLSGNNTYGGSTTINTGGALNIQHANALGSTVGDTTVNSGGTLQIQGGITTAAEELSLAGTGVDGLGALRNISGDNTFGGTITLQNVAGVHRINSDAGTLTLNAIGETGTADKILTIGGAGNVTVNGVISSDGLDIALVKDGAGTLTLNAVNTYTGTTTLGGTGILKLGVNNALGSGAFVFAGGILDANDTTDATIGALSLTANSTLELHPGTAGTLTFTGTATRTGGTLTVNGWSGFANTAGTDDKIIVTGLADAAFLSNVNFTGYAPGATQLGGVGGEIVPVPEPINAALGFFGAVFAMFGLGRRFCARAGQQA